MYTNSKTVAVRYLVTNGNSYLNIDSGASYFSSLENAKYFQKQNDAINTAFRAVELRSVKISEVKIIQVNLNIVDECSLQDIKKKQIEDEIKQRQMELYTLSLGES